MFLPLRSYLMRKKILVFTVPFGGHLTILKELISLLHDSYDLKLVITGWDNIPPDLSGLPIRPVVLSAGVLSETDPALWTFPRMATLLPQCMRIAKQFHPDLILYDFFSPEGYMAGSLLHIPFWCSIPAMPGPFRHRTYLAKKLQDPGNRKAMERLASGYGIRFTPSDLELISDGIHFPGERNIVWSYRDVVPKNWAENRKCVPYVFAGNIRGKKTTVPHGGTTVLFSFGTVVLDNLWNRQPKTRKLLTAFIARMTKFWNRPDISVVFVTQGKHILKSYPANWTVVEKNDQIAALSSADVFVTHAGSNSFHEALVARVPMVAIPFFGDQPLVAKRMAQLGLGIDLVNESGIDTRKSKQFLNAALAKRLDYEVRGILRNRSSWQSKFDKIDMSAPSVKSIFSHI